MDSKKIKFRQAIDKDSVRIAELCIQLGYQMNEIDVLEQLQKIFANEDTSVIVAEIDNLVTGWIQVSIRSAIESGEIAEINGLIVDEKFRGNRIGKSLVLKSEEWARNKGLKEIRVRTNITRKETHLFYQGIGFEEKKEQTVFQKKLK